MKLDRSELVRLLHTQGENDTADKVEQQLPEEVDTDRRAFLEPGEGGSDELTGCSHLVDLRGRPQLDHDERQQHADDGVARRDGGAEDRGMKDPQCGGQR